MEGIADADGWYELKCDRRIHSRGRTVNHLGGPTPFPSVVMGGFPRQHAEIVVVRRQSAADGGEEQEEADDGVADRRALAIQRVPLAGLVEGEDREDEQDSRDSEPDQGRHGEPALVFVRGRDVRALWRESTRWGRRLGVHDLHVLVVFATRLLVAAVVAVHEPCAVLSAYTYAAMARTCSSLNGPPPRGGIIPGYSRG